MTMQISSFIRCCTLPVILFLGVTVHAQTQPRITVTDFTYTGPSEYFQISPVDAATQSKSSPAFSVKPSDLTRFTVDLKGNLLQQGAYRLMPNINWESNYQSTLTDLLKAIDDKKFPESDYILFGSINYVNALTSLSSDAKRKTKTYGLTLQIVGEFNLINTATKQTDVYFTVMGVGTDSNTGNIASNVIPVNKSKILKNASTTLASAIAGELEYQLTPAKIQERIRDSEHQPSPEHKIITIK